MPKSRHQMKEKQRRVQLALVSIGVLLFVLTYLYYPTINKNELSKNRFGTEDFENTSDMEHYTYFTNLEYKGLYDLDKPFKVKSEKAYILNEEPDIVYMQNMHVVLYLKDNRIVEITSLKGHYNKANYNCFFEQNVRVTEGETIITAENLDLLATENFVKIYNNVNLDYITGWLQADKIDYDFETKNFKVSMFDDKKIKMKVVR